MTDRAWLHGWPLIGKQVLVGTGIYCAGCGKDQGVATVGFDEAQWQQPGPDWPFDESDCPVHNPEDTSLQARLRKYRESHPES